MVNKSKVLWYTKTHEWIYRDGDICVVGITEYAQQLLGDMVFIELPEIDRKLNQGEACAVVESVKAASDIYVPIAGQVTAFNTKLEAEPELVNSEPYGEGWLFKIKPNDVSQLNTLMNESEYKALLHINENS